LALLVHESKGEPMQIVVERGGNTLPPIEVRAKPDPNNKMPDTNEPQYRMGIGLSFSQEREQHGFLTNVKHALYYPVLKTQEIYSAIREMIAGRQEGRITGPVGIGKTISKAVEYGWIVALSLFMTINVWLALVNLLPLPALDGGRLVFLIYEMATRRRANPKIEATVHMVGIMLFLLLMVAVTYNDCTSDFP
jgi:regulator of sigma E protease